MTRPSKKDIEIYFAKTTAKLLDKLWDVRASEDEGDWPDLIVKTKLKEFGLEVREIYIDELRKGSEKKGLEAKSRSVIKQLANSYYKSSKIPIKVENRGDISRLENLLDAIKEAVPALERDERKELIIYNGCVVYIQRLPNSFGEYRRWSYLSDTNGWVGKFDNIKIQNFIESKSAKLPKYKKHISDVRLLLVSNRVSNSGKADIEHSFNCNRHGFNAVYYLSYPIGARKLSC